MGGNGALVLVVAVHRIFLSRIITQYNTSSANTVNNGHGPGLGVPGTWMDDGVYGSSWC